MYVYVYILPCVYIYTRIYHLFTGQFLFVVSLFLFCLIILRNPAGTAVSVDQRGIDMVQQRGSEGGKEHLQLICFSSQDVESRLRVSGLTHAVSTVSTNHTHTLEA